MIINCVWEHNVGDTLLYATNFIGAYTRGESLLVTPQNLAPLYMARSYPRKSHVPNGGERSLATLVDGRMLLGNGSEIPML